MRLFTSIAMGLAAKGVLKERLRRLLLGSSRWRGWRRGWDSVLFGLRFRLLLLSLVLLLLQGLFLLISLLDWTII
jgi:hypothetical protein